MEKASSLQANNVFRPKWELVMLHSMINREGRLKVCRLFVTRCKEAKRVYSQRKAGQCNCGNGENCCCRSGVGSWTFPPPQGWPPPILVCWAATQTKNTHYWMLNNFDNKVTRSNCFPSNSVRKCVCASVCLAGKQGRYCWWHRGLVARIWGCMLYSNTVRCSRRPLHTQRWKVIKYFT